MTVASEGVCGGFRIGEDMTAARLWMVSSAGLSARSARESSVGAAGFFVFAGVWRAVERW